MSFTNSDSAAATTSGFLGEGGSGSGGDPVLSKPRLPTNEVVAANRNAQVKGIALGIGSGFLAGLVSRKSLRLSPNASVLSGFITGSFMAWYGSRQFLIKGLQNLESQLSALRGDKAGPGGLAVGPGQHRGILHGGQSEADRLDLRSADERRFEAGTGGLHELRDPYATTRGDH